MASVCGYFAYIEFRKNFNNDCVELILKKGDYYFYCKPKPNEEDFRDINQCQDGCFFLYNPRMQWDDLKSCVKSCQEGL